MDGTDPIRPRDSARHEAWTNYLERDRSKSCAKTASRRWQAADVGGPRANRPLPGRDEPGNPFVRRDAGQEKPIKIGAKVVPHGRYVAIVRRAPPGLTRGADLTGFCGHRGKGPALPKSVERGNLSRAVTNCRA